MADLSDEQLAAVRDEIGDATPPTDDDLNDSFAALGSWVRVALRVLQRRRAAIAGGATASSFNLSGVLSVSQSSNLAALDRQIARLQGMVHAEDPDAVDVGSTSSTLLRRVGRRWR